MSCRVDLYVYCPMPRAAVDKGQEIGMENLRYRHELKFLCSAGSSYVMENKIRHVCKPDPYADDRGRYVIRSLYFDSYGDRCFREGIDGTDERKKYRIRIYNGCSEMIRLECKYSVHGMKAKESCVITERQCESLIRNRPVPGIGSGQGELLARFLAEQKAEFLQPKVIVEYTRSPYIYEAGNVRITFDRNLGSGWEVEKFLEPCIRRRGVFPVGEELLEVKYDEVLPAAIAEILAAGQQLSSTSFSKYVLCRKCGMR